MSIPASENQFPFVTAAEQASAPATPGAGLARLFRSDDGLWYEVDDAGVVSLLNWSQIESQFGQTRELDYAETTSTSTSTANGVVNQIPGLVVSYVFDGTTPVLVEAWANLGTNHVDTLTLLLIEEEIDGMSPEIICYAWNMGPAKSAVDAGTNQTLARARRTPPAGLATYRAKFQKVGTATGTASVEAYSYQPASIRIVGVDVA